MTSIAQMWEDDLRPVLEEISISTPIVVRYVGSDRKTIMYLEDGFDKTVTKNDW